MPIIDNEVIGESSAVTPPSQPIGEFFQQAIQRNIERNGDSVWMKDTSTGRSMKYSEIAPATKSIASALWKKGFRRSDRVMIMAANFIAVPLTFLGTWKTGGGCACLTLNLPASEIRRRAESVKPTFMVTDEQHADIILEAVAQLDYVKEVFVIGNAERCTPFDTLLQDDGQDCPEEMCWDSDDLVWLMFSSGTTGIPKGIVHTHRSLKAFITNYPEMLYTGKRFVFINLMMNSGGMMFNLLASHQHAEMYCMSNLSDDNLLVAIDKFKPDVVCAFPPQIAYICQHPNLDEYQLKSVTVIVSGGSSINPFFERQIYDKMPNLMALITHYGMSEVGAICSTYHKTFDALQLMDKTEAIQNHVVGSCGQLFSNCKLKVIDELTDKKLGPNEIGHVCVNTPSMMKEYLNNAKATVELIRDGWCHTGDKGYYDTNGNVFIIGRYKELIKYRMAHVVPTNIETYLMTHEAVEDAGVVGLPDDVDGELPMAFVVLKPGLSATAQDIIAFVNDKVMDEEKLRGGVRFIDKIPRNELGKVVRTQLAKLLH